MSQMPVLPALQALPGTTLAAPPPMRARVGQLARGEAARVAEKRKGAEVTEEEHYRDAETNGEEAPWKKQRKRARRVPRASSATVASTDAGAGSGADADGTVAGAAGAAGTAGGEPGAAG